MTKIALERRLIIDVGSVDKAIIIDEIQIRLKNKKHNDCRYHDGHWYVRMSKSDFKDLVPWSSEMTIRRNINSLRERGLILVEKLADDPWDQTYYYASTWS